MAKFFQVENMMFPYKVVTKKDSKNEFVKTCKPVIKKSVGLARFEYDNLFSDMRDSWTSI